MKNQAYEKEPDQLGQEFVMEIANFLANNVNFRESLQQKNPVFFRAIVTDSRTSGGILQVQIKRTGQTTADTFWYPVMDAGYTNPTAGDDVLLAYLETKRTAAVIGARSVARSLGTREPLVDRLGRALTDSTEGIIYAYTS